MVSRLMNTGWEQETRHAGGHTETKTDPGNAETSRAGWPQCKLPAIPYLNSVQQQSLPQPLQQQFACFTQLHCCHVEIVDTSMLPATASVLGVSVVDTAPRVGVTKPRP
jgi:hypothetical protein